MSQESLEDKIISVKNDYIKGDEMINEIQRLGSFWWCMHRCTFRRQALKFQTKFSELHNTPIGLDSVIGCG